MTETIEQRLKKIESELRDLQSKTIKKDRICLFVFSGDWDKIFSAFVMGTGAAASGSEVIMFFTFWGVSAIKKSADTKKSFVEHMFGMLMPKNIESLRLSKFNFLGIGPLLMNYTLKRKNIPKLSEMRKIADELGVKIKVCEMSANLLGISREEIVPYQHLTFCGVQEFLNEASQGQLTLYI